MPSMSIRLAAAPITWGVCELPAWGEVPPFPSVLDEMALLGFQGTELGPAGYLPQDPDALRRELRARRLELVGAFCPLTLHDPALAPCIAGERHPPGAIPRRGGLSHAGRRR